MSILSTIGRLASEYSEARSRYLTERSIRVPARPKSRRTSAGRMPQATHGTTRLHSGSWAGDR